MKRTWGVLMAILALVYAISCSTVPITGRSQANLLPEQELISMANEAYTQFLAESQVVSAYDKRVVMVREVGGRIRTAVERYLTEHGQSDRVQGFSWQFNVVNSDEVNAWCMPGGKVVVYTGILPLTKDEVGMAVIMGHEIAHAVARHGNERMSQGLLVNLGLSSLSLAMGQNPTYTQQLFMQSMGIGSTLGMLSFSRKHETEADRLGLVFMAMAGYDPQTAVSFWERMAATGSGQPLEWLSTHPSHTTRISDLKHFMPEALDFYTRP